MDNKLEPVTTDFIIIDEKENKRFKIPAKKLIVFILLMLLLFATVISVIVNSIKKSKQQNIITINTVSETTDEEIPIIERDTDVMPTGTIILNDDSYVTYATQSDALNHVMGLPSNLSDGCTVKGCPEPNTNTARMRVVVDYVSEGYLPAIEEFLYPGDDWTSTIDFSNLAGKTIVLMFASETGDLIPKVTYEYVAFKIPN